MLVQLLNQARRPLYLVLGAGLVMGGLAIGSAGLFERYQAQFGLPYARDPAFFVRVDLSMHSAAELDRFARRVNLSGDPDFALLKAQYEASRGRPVNITRVALVSATDNRDPSRDKTPAEEIRIVATSRTAEQATHLALIALQYFRESAVRVDLERAVVEWSDGAKAEIAKLRETINNYYAALKQNEYKIREMQALLDTYQKSKDQYLTDPGTQVQVTGARNLSPLQQMIGLQSDRVEIQNSINVAQEAEQRVGAMGVLVSEVRPRLQRGDSPITVATDLVSEFSKSSGENDHDWPRSIAASRVLSLLFDFVGRSPEPPAPVLTSAGIGGTTAVVLGALAGGCVWLLIIYAIILIRTAERLLHRGANR